MVNWGALLVMLTAASENFALLCRETHQLRPSTYDNPWTAILYVDEVIIVDVGWFRRKGCRVKEICSTCNPARASG